MATLFIHFQNSGIKICTDHNISDVYQKGIDFTVKMFDLLFVYICRKVGDKKP